MKQCIRGDAQYMLMDMTSINQSDEFVNILRQRFGASAHAERFRAERLQLRRGKLTLEQLHMKVGTLVSKAAPGSWTSLTEIYARDAFLTALDDNELRRRIMVTCPPPTTLATAYDLALRATAIDVEMGDVYDHRHNRSPQPHRTRQARVLVGGSCGPAEASSQLMRDLAEENRKLKEADHILRPIIELLRADQPRPSWKELHSNSAEIYAYWAQYRSLEFTNNVWLPSSFNIMLRRSTSIRWTRPRRLSSVTRSTDIWT